MDTVGEEEGRFRMLGMEEIGVCIAAGAVFAFAFATAVSAWWNFGRRA